jgi:hypothetical protein
VALCFVAGPQLLFGTTPCLGDPSRLYARARSRPSSGHAAAAALLASLTSNYGRIADLQAVVEIRRREGDRIFPAQRGRLLFKAPDKFQLSIADQTLTLVGTTLRLIGGGRALTLDLASLPGSSDAAAFVYAPALFLSQHTFTLLSASDRECVLEAVPIAPDSFYSRIKIQADPVQQVDTRVEYYDPNGELRLLKESLQGERFGGVSLATSIRETLFLESVAVVRDIRSSEVQVNAGFPDELFASDNQRSTAALAAEPERGPLLSVASAPGPAADPPKELVVFVHGMCSSRKAWDEMISTLRGCLDPARYDLVAFDYSKSTFDDINANAAALCAFLDLRRAQYGSIKMVAHSLGGIVARACLNSKFDSLPGTLAERRRNWASAVGVTHLITLGTPHDGTLAASVGMASLASDVFGDMVVPGGLPRLANLRMTSASVMRCSDVLTSRPTMVSQLEPESTFMRSLNRPEVLANMPLKHLAIGGKLKGFRLDFQVLIPGGDDGYVELDSVLGKKSLALYTGGAENRYKAVEIPGARHTDLNKPLPQIVETLLSEIAPERPPGATCDGMLSGYWSLEADPPISPPCNVYACLGPDPRAGRCVCEDAPTSLPNPVSIFGGGQVAHVGDVLSASSGTSEASVSLRGTVKEDGRTGILDDEVSFELRYFWPAMSTPPGCAHPWETLYKGTGKVVEALFPPIPQCLTCERYFVIKGGFTVNWTATTGCLPCNLYQRLTCAGGGRFTATVKR